MQFIVDPSFHLWFSLIITGFAIFAFVNEKIALEVSAIALMVSLLLFGQLFPLYDVNGSNQLGAEELLRGFANPSLMAVLALLVVGQGLIQTDALRGITRLFYVQHKALMWVAVVGILLFVALSSAFLNNTPLVIIAIPILQAMASNLKVSESRIMMPLSFAAILGGMMTLIGSSTNLLVSTSMKDLGYEPLGFFDQTIPGAMLLGVGLIYVIFILPRFLPKRSSFAQSLRGNQKEFIAELDIEPGSKLIGLECVEGRFPTLPDLSIRMIQRSGHLILPPFEGYKIEPGDIMIVAATREALADVLASYPGFILSAHEMEEVEQSRKAREVALERQKIQALDVEEGVDEDDADVTATAVMDHDEVSTRILAEVMITPTSRLIEMSLENAGFEALHGVTVLGIQRRARVVRRRLGRVRLESGDVLLIAGSQAALDNMRGSPDFVVMAGTIRDLPARAKAPVALLIFLFTVVSAALGFLPIPIAAFAGATFMIILGCLNLRQAVRSLDRKIYLLVGSALALGSTLQVTNAAATIADTLISLPFVQEPLIMVSVMFILVAICTNVLTNNACAILFTPIAMSMGVDMGIDPTIMALTVIFAANCSFASPIGYQTNLLVMGPGHYRFKDFIIAGVPLVVILWIAFIIIAKYYYGL